MKTNVYAFSMFKNKYNLILTKDNYGKFVIRYRHGLDELDSQFELNEDVAFDLFAKLERSYEI